MMDLLDVIDELTLPRIEHLAQRTDTGDWVRTVTIEHPALLAQLEDAGTTGGTGGGTAAKHERSIIDTEAAHMYAQYRAEIAAWCRSLSVKPPRRASDALRAWYAATRAHSVNEDAYRVILSRWAGAIRTHFDPPKRFEAPDPCPACNSSTYGNQYTGGGKAIEITYRVDDAGRTTGERALCRACLTVWSSGDSVRELAEELQEKRETA